MFTRHVSGRIAPYLDGRLTPREAQRAQSHLAHCARCQGERDQIRFGMEILDHLPLVDAPPAIWTSIEAVLRENRSRGRVTPRLWRLVFVAAMALVLASVAYWRLMHPTGTRWDVVPLNGTPAVGSISLRGAGKVGAGEWIETDSGSRASIKVGDIGSVEIEPNTRLRVVTARSREHRLALAQGEIRASISAPPRLFFVDTASGTAIDLGCEYSLNTDEEGSGLLRVTRGWVSFQWNGLESLVPAGASCRTRPHLGPGIPYFDDAPESLKEALDRFGFKEAENGDLGVILEAARVRDTLTLWHLLSRVPVNDRALVYDRIASLTPVPPGISRDKALKLDPDTLNRWKDELAWTW